MTSESSRPPVVSAAIAIAGAQVPEPGASALLGLGLLAALHSTLCRGDRSAARAASIH